jgi:hypothetical protein
MCNIRHERTVANEVTWCRATQGLCVHTGQHTHRHQCFEWDSNPLWPAAKLYGDSVLHRLCNTFTTIRSAVLYIGPHRGHQQMLRRSGFGYRQGQNLSLLCSVQTASGAHPVSYPMGTGGVELTTHLHLAPRSRNILIEYTTWTYNIYNGVYSASNRNEYQKH